MADIVLMKPDTVSAIKKGLLFLIQKDGRKFICRVSFVDLEKSEIYVSFWDHKHKDWLTSYEIGLASLDGLG